tara:strand:+ start:142 stop:315 length:174 start_codon:yes stop_codon:yes gene_type:complete
MAKPKLKDAKETKKINNELMASEDGISDDEIVNFEAIAPTYDDINEELELMGTFLND